MFKKLFIFVLGCALPLFGEIENSILPFLDQLTMNNLSGKMDAEQLQVLDAALHSKEEALRVMSFNMLFNLPYSEAKLDDENRWPRRGQRLIAYLLESHADVIGSQELQKEQLNALLKAFKGKYSYYGLGVQDGKEGGDIPAIFYRTDRIELLQGMTFYFSETPMDMSSRPFNTISRK